MPPELAKEIDNLIDINIQEGLHPELRWTDKQWEAYEKQQDTEEDTTSNFE